MDAWHLVEPIGFTGGILLLWKSDIVDFQVIGEGAQGVHGVMEVRATSKSFVFSAIYASPRFRMRKMLWEELLSLSSNLDKPWLLLGDFNDIINENEKMGGRKISYRRSKLFSDAINNCNLIDMGFIGPRFTWTNNRSTNPIYQRLDRGWSNVEWVNMFPNYSLSHLPRLTSDHCPILLNLEQNVRATGPKPFRFEPMWILDKHFLDIVDQAWPKYTLLISEKLDVTRDVLIDLNHSTFGNVYIRKRHILARLKGTQNYLHSNPSSRYHQNLEKDLTNELMGILD